MRKAMDKKEKLYGGIVATLILATVLGIAYYNFELLPKLSQSSTGQFSLVRFSSLDELKTFLNRSRITAHSLLSGWTFGIPDVNFGSLAGIRSEAAIDAKSPAIPEYSTTNIQVAGVDEADVVKTDGQYIYISTSAGIAIIRAYPPEEAELLSQIRLNGSLLGIFVRGDRLAIVEASYYTDSYRPDRTTISFYAPKTLIKVYDLTDRRSPVQKRNVSLDGSYFRSRMIGDYAYVVITQPAYLSGNNISLPKIFSDNGAVDIRATDIYHTNVSDYYYSFTTILAINTFDDTQKPSHETILTGATSGLYMSRDNVYLTFQGGSTPNTRIYRIRVDGSEIDPKADGEVPGRILNQFSMDEYGDYFRVATTSGPWPSFGTSQRTSANNVYVLDMNMTIVGRLEGIAPGESIYSARFMGDRGHLVTFKKVDPLFVLNLSNPREPKVLGKLKIPGYSDYLHPYGEGHLIGVGKETVEAKEGDFAWYQGVKISLFNVSDVEMPRELYKYEIGDRGTESPVLRDHKAFLFDKSKKLLVIPVLVAEIDEWKYPSGVPPNAYGDYVWQGVYVFNISLEGGLVLRGRITHIEDGEDFLKSGYYFQSSYSIERALYIGDVLYTISDKKIRMNSLETMAQKNELELPSTATSVNVLASPAGR